MRFATEKEGLEYIKGKKIRNAADPRVKIKPESIAKGSYLFNKWLERKKFMFSPEELITLRGEDYRGHKGQKNQAIRNHHVNTFVDWAEERPRRKAIIVIGANQKRAATAIAKQIDIIGGDNTFSGLGLSADGKEPATHFWCNWNCSASEYDFFEKQEMPWWKVYDGQLMTPDEVLAFEGLEKIQPEDIIETTKGMK